ncbi:MAG: hypothetical protein R3E96_04950 [Planctomycetota bacterium]
MSYDANPFDPFERIGSHGGLPGVQGRKTRRRRLPWLFGLLGLGLIYWFGLRGASPDPVEAAESAGGAGIVLDAAQGKPLVQPPVAGANGPAAPEVTAAPVVAPKPKPAARAPGAEALERQVNEIVARHMATAAKNSKNKVRAANTDVAVHVRGVDGAVWVDRSTSKALMPASNLKLVTCAAAMQLAPEGRLRNPVRGPRRGARRGARR